MALPSNLADTQPPAHAGKGKFLFPFIMVTSLFFFWGFIHNLDGILIAHLRRGFNLNTVKASLVDSAVYLGYFIMAVPAGIIMKKYGYKTGILIGLALFAGGCFLFIPAANTMQYAFFLGALFILACGLAILETAANPYATILGNPKTSTQRLNFAQSFNGFAAFLAPLIGAKLILSETPIDDAGLAAMTEQVRNAYLHQETATVKLPYMILGIAIVVVFLIFFFTKLPDIKDAEEKEKKSIFHAFHHRHLTWAVIAEFCYVGAQVCVFNFLILFATKVASITDQQAAFYAGLAGLAFMIGRFAGTFFMRYIQPSKLLSLYAVACVLLCLVIIFASGLLTLYATVALAFFMSIMFPTIFALGIHDIGADTKSGSTLLIMSIVGGAILPRILAFISDKTDNFQYGYIVPLVCFVIILYFGLKGYKHSEKAIEVLH
ncbi:MAG: L-fucose:H+ symporter permease [Chitinophagaceae bacterium]